MDFPRVLIVSSSTFNKVTGGGVLFTNLFHGWPGDSLASVHRDPTPVDDSTCQRFYRLTLREMRWVFPFSLFQDASAPPASPATRGAGPAPSRDRLKTWLGGGLPWTTRLSRRLIDWIRDFGPDVLYVTPGTPYMSLASAIAKRFHLPVVVHMMDDWPSTFGRGGLLGPFLRFTASRELRRLLRSARVRLAISDEMCRAYEARYGMSFDRCHNGIETARLPFRGRERKPGEPFRVVYTGSLLPEAQLESVVEVARAVSEMAAQGRAIRFAVHSPQADQYRSRVEGSAVGVEAPVVGDAFLETLASADALLLPVNFDETSWRYVRYSLPVKLPYYLMSGTPILVYGPPEVGYVADAIEKGWALPVTRRGASALKDAIARLADDQALGTSLRERAREYGATHFDIQAIRSRFETAVKEAAAVPA